MAKVKCALLDRERRIYLGMTEVEEADVDPGIHLAQITACDLPPNVARWVPDAANPFGGSFEPLPREQRAKADRPTLEHALAFDLLARRAAGQALADVSLAWLDDVALSVDFKVYATTPLLSSYIADRGIAAKKEG